MSYRINGITVISAEKPQKCDDCGKIDELRPYGKDGACVCFSCAMKDEENMKRRLRKHLFNE